MREDGRTGWSPPAWARCLAPVGTQVEQHAEVTLEEQTFVAKQTPLPLGMLTVIAIRNQEGEWHDFGWPMFQGTYFLGQEIERCVAGSEKEDRDPLYARTTRAIRIQMFDPSRHEGRVVGGERRSGLKTHET